MSRTPISQLSRVFSRPPYDLVLTREEERALVPLARAGDRSAILKLYRGNARVYVIAARKHKDYAERYGLELDDLIAEALMDFPAALVAYKPELGAEFGAYLYARTQYFVSGYIREAGPLIRVPRPNKSSRPATVQAALNALKAVSLDVLLEECPHLEPGALDDEETPAADPEAIQAVRNALRDLTPTQKRIVDLFYGFSGPRENKAMIAKRMGVSKDSVCQTEQLARKRLLPVLSAQAPLRGGEMIPRGLAAMFNAVRGYAL